MHIDHTQQQSSEAQERAQALSLNRTQPPAQVPGYEPRRFLGAGAFGEVWVAIDRTTGRQVAIKFYAHRGGLDWSLLSHEVEKLAFLSADRYVVQLLDVGWDSEPPYYVMEYVERGSLEDHLRREGRLGASEAVSLFRDVATGLLHAHGKGVLHCDLKPANVLLDQDAKPRLADFGQSRLSHDQTPALGTLFYMAPEQADLTAVPDVRWDVYALGALLYCMLTGAPPHRSDNAVTEIETAADLDERLTRYRELIANSPPPTGHRQTRGVDRSLADIIDRCLAAGRNERFANVQEVMDALDARDQYRARRPLLVLGAIGPAIILVVMSVFGWQWFETIIGQSDDALRQAALTRNNFAAQYVAKTVSNELDRRFRAVEEMATSSRFQRMLEESLSPKETEFTKLREQLSDPQLSEEDRKPLREQFLTHPARQALQVRLQELLADTSEPPVAGWFVTDEDGLQLARAPDSPTIGLNYSWRSYFNGDPEDHPIDWRPEDDMHITHTHLSPVFRSQADNRWVIVISTPIIKEGPEAHFLGIMAMAVQVDQFVELQQQDRLFSVLVDWRKGSNQGLILQHPLFKQVLAEQTKLPERFKDYRVRASEMPDTAGKRENYVDPMASDPQGGDFDRHWLAEVAKVEIRDTDIGWRVIVQESYERAIGRTLSQLKTSLWTSGILAVALIAVLSMALWGYVIRVLGGDRARIKALTMPPSPPPEPAAQ